MSFRIDQLAVLNLATVGNSITAGSFVKSGGTSSQFLKADGTVDTNAYITGITSTMVTTALGYTPVPNTRNITINGVTQDLSVDRTWTISAGVASVSGSGAGISVSPTTGAVVVSNTGVTSNVAGTGISVSGATGAVTITNTGVTSIVAGTAITISGATGAVTINNAGVTSLNGSTGALTGFATQAWVTSQGYITSASVGNGTLTLAVSGSGLSGSASFTANQSTATTFTVTSNATNANTASTIVFRDASGNFSAGTITAALSGNASTASTWQTARTLTIGSTGKSVNGSADVSWSLSEIGALPSGILQQGGKPYVTHDFNTYPNLYDVTFVNPSGSSNLPTGMGSVMSYRFIMGAGDTTTRGVDLVVAAESNGNMYMRERSIGVWSRMLHSNNYNSYAPTLTGGGASGTWSINITGNAGYASSAGNADTVDNFHASQSTVANNIVVRDANGYIFGNYINMTDDGNPGGGTAISSFITKQGDNYYRSVSPTNAMVSIRGVASGSWGINISGNAATTSQTNFTTLTLNSATVATQTWVTSQGYVTGGPFVPVSGGVNMTGSYGLNDNKLYLRTNGDNNHYLWNAGDDWEELNAYEGTGFRITSVSGSVGVLYVYGSSNGGYTYSPYSFRAPIFYDSDDTAYYGNFASTSRMNNIMLGSTYSPSYQGQLVLGHTSYNFNFLNGSWAGSITAGILANCADEYEFAIHDSGNSVESLFIYAGGRILMGRDIGWGTTYIEAAESFRAPIFYDTNDTAYYGNFASTSVMNSIAFGTSTNGGTISGNSDWGMRLTTSSGYIQFGPANGSWAHIYSNLNFYMNTHLWISGGYKVTAWDYNNGGGDLYAVRYYDANDTSYYVDPNGESNLWRFTAASMTRNAINYLSINSPYTTRSVQGTAYYNGTMGWGQIDFNTIFSNWGSGFIDTWSNPGNAPGGSTHYVGLQGLHYNFQNSSQGYGFQMACAGEADNRFFWRSAWPNLRSWVEMIHSGNIGSQSVSNADTVDGYHATAFPYRSGGSSGYYQVADWMQFNTSAGLYWPSYYNAHIEPNTSSSYGSINIRGSKNGWAGINFSDSNNNLMVNSNESGIHKGGYGWQFRWYQGTLYCSRGTYGGGTEYTVWDSGNLTNLNQLSNGPGYITSSSNVVGLYSSGFGSSNFTWYQSPTPLSPYTGSWASYLVSNHGDGATYYNQTIVMPFWGIPEYFRKEGGTNRGPYQFFTSEHGSTFTYATNMNQYVRTSDNPTFGNIYSNGWFRNNNNNQGLYSENTTMHWSSKDNGYWDASSTTTVSSIRFWTGGHVSSLRGYVYANTSNEIGFLNSGGSWSLRMDNSGNATATGDVTAYSDARVKENVITVENALDKILNLRGVYYNRIDTEDKRRKVGVIAQEIMEVLPEVVGKDTDGMYNVAYGNIVGVLIEAIKEQQKQIDELKARLD